MVFSRGCDQSWLGPYYPLFTPRLSEFGLIGAVHSISTLSMSHWMYSEWFCKLEIWIHHPQPSPHPGFWVTGGEKFGSRSLRFTRRLIVCRMIQPFHIISTHAISHHKYNEWLDKVEIDVWSPNCLPQPIFWSWVGTTSALPKFTFCTQIEYVWTNSGNSQHLNPSNLWPLLC